MSGDQLDFEDSWIAGSDIEQVELTDNDDEPTVKTKKRKNTCTKPIQQKKQKVQSNETNPIKAVFEESDKSSSELISDYIWNYGVVNAHKKRNNQTLTDLEIIDLRKYQLPESRIQLITDYNPSLFQSIKSCVIILCSGAIRCTSVIRDIKSESNGDIRTIKMFAKHMKVEQQAAEIKRLANDRFVGVGTPNRVLKLMKSTDLLDKVGLIVLDSFVDAKNRSILDIPECRSDFFELFQHVEAEAPTKLKWALSSS